MSSVKKITFAKICVWAIVAIVVAGCAGSAKDPTTGTDAGSDTWPVPPNGNQGWPQDPSNPGDPTDDMCGGCPDGKICVDGLCVVDDGQSTDPTTPTPGDCAETCDGCCNSQGECRSFLHQSSSSCGANGAACSPCDTGKFCDKAGQCVSESTTPTDPPTSTGAKFALRLIKLKLETAGNQFCVADDCDLFLKIKINGIEKSSAKKEGVGSGKTVDYNQTLFKGDAAFTSDTVGDIRFRVYHDTWPSDVEISDCKKGGFSEDEMLTTKEFSVDCKKDLGATSVTTTKIYFKFEKQP